MKSRSEVKIKAKELLKGNMWNIFGIMLLMSIIQTVISKIPNWFGVETFITERTIMFNQIVEVAQNTAIGWIWNFILLVITGFLTFGIAYYALNIIRGTKKGVGDTFIAMGKQALTIITVSIITDILVSVGVFCFIIPGVILLYGFMMVSFIMVDNPDMKFLDVIKTSWNMMKGHKFEAFVYELSFIGWALLCIFIIPIIYVMPYIVLTFALFYEELKLSTSSKSEVNEEEITNA